MLKHLFTRKIHPFQPFNKALKRLVKEKLVRRDTSAIIEGALKLEQLQVRDVMLPRAKMMAIHQGDSFKQILSLILDKLHSRFPVIDKETDKVTGILLAKDLLTFFNKDTASFKINDVLRPALFIPESKKLIELLNDFRKKHNHMAIVVDEYGGIAGLITIEDVLEQVVGDIVDESDMEENQQYVTFYQNNGKQKLYHLDALTPIAQFNTFFNTNVRNEDFDTIGGIVMHAFGYVPEKGESVSIKNMCIEIIDADKRHIKKLQVTTKLN